VALNFRIFKLKFRKSGQLTTKTPEKVNLFGGLSVLLVLQLFSGEAFEFGDDDDDDDDYSE